MSIKSGKKMTNVTIRLTEEQKTYFEKASKIGRFKTLSDFMIASAREFADKGFEHHHQILSSEKDQVIFFHALLHSGKPNARLKRAAGRYKNFIK